MLAEKVMVVLGVEQILSKFRFAGEQPKCIRFNHGEPKSRLSAYRAVAFVCTRAQVNVRLKADRAAVAASGVCLLHITLCLGGRRLDLIVTAAYELQ